MNYHPIKFHIMKSLLFILTFIVVIFNDITAQEVQTMRNDSELPYRQIPDYPDSYTPENVAARVIDGLGYRYFWATEGLTGTDLDYRPGNGGRSTLETIDHIYGLSLTILNASMNQANVFPREDPVHTFEETRRMTLDNFKNASQVLKESKTDTMKDLKVIFKSVDSTSEYPFWNMLNGPISDAIYHTGQVVSFRRSSGNPINPNVRVFLGKTSE
jgi:hypothetical protein